VYCAINQRHKLEHLCRYIICPAITNERLTLNRASQMVPTLIRISPTSIIAILTDGNQ
jgi:Putative transposase